MALAVGNTVEMGDAVADAVDDAEGVGVGDAVGEGIGAPTQPALSMTIATGRSRPRSN